MESDKQPAQTGKKKERSFSGIQPSGDIHIGNYVGAIRNWIGMLDKYDCIFCVVDYHAITVEYDISQMPTRIRDAVVVNIAAGLDPERCLLFVQSHVPEHTELAWVLNNCTSIGDLERMTQFKEKSDRREFISAGLFDYPVLMAADILLYKATVVPVGDDQVQHVELCRRIARKFNGMFGETFQEPHYLLGTAPRVMGLDAKAKMSKSLGNYISLIEEPDAIWEKLRTAATDPARQRRKDPGNPDICNIFTMHKGFSPPEDLEWVRQGCTTAGIGCIECKKRLFENMMAALNPIRERSNELKADPDYVADVIRGGAERCREIAGATLQEVRQKLGIR